MRPTLALPVDVIRKFDPQITEDSLNTFQEGISPIGNDDYETMVSRIESVESQVASETGTPYKRRQQGVESDKRTWEVPNRVERQDSDPYPRVFVNLGDRNITEVKGVQIRDGFDSWNTIDSDNYSVNYRDGTINIQWLSLPQEIRKWIDHQGYNVRVAYEHGALGGSHNTAGQTEITGSVAQGDDAPTVSVDDAPRLPSSGTFLLGEEYVSGSVDYSTGEVNITERGLRRTNAKQHDSGTGIHYCPMQVRDAVAAKTAIETLNHVDKIDESIREQFNPEQKQDTWKNEWETLIETSGNFGSL